MNRKIAWTIFACVAAFGMQSKTANAELANSQLQGLRVHTVEGVLRLPADQIDLGTAALIISRNWGTNKTLYTYRRKIDSMAEEIQRRLHEKKVPLDARAVAEINRYLFEEQRFQSVKTADNPDDLFLHTVLDQKRGYCLSLSVLYLAVGERLGLPLYGVVVPGHFFVRYDDGKIRFNIETTAGGGTADDAYYRDTFKPPVGHPLYMANLDKRQTLGCFFNNLGNSYKAVGQIDQALLELSRAVQINPTLAEARTNLGNIYLQKGRIAQAIEEYQQALRFLPDDPKTLNNLGNAYLQQNELQHAAQSYLKALDFDPSLTDAHRNLAHVYRRQGLTDKALEHLRIALGLAPQEAENYLALGRLHFELKNLPAAQEMLAMALHYNPSLTAARIELGNVYLEMNRNDWAIEEFSKALQGDDVLSPYAWFGLANAYHQEKRYEDAVYAYRQVLSRDPQNTAALQNLGNVLLDAGRIDEAVQAYQQAIQISPASGLYYNLAVAFLRQKLYDKALSNYQQAVRLEPNYAAAHHGLAVCYYYLNDKPACRKHAQIARSLGWNVEEELLK
ncbi:MAG TPA: tetratricopeptide repeat protein [Anaerohalosphaeraceae bacterium]|nr:tetratricopeptide repeat protein [Anaerohalosphaeraceae bacterium]HOL88648.1 tetratricopeptide repeat protein [Anaerohalosphaeraceae bacterium]